MRELNLNEVSFVSGAYGQDFLLNVVEAATCSIGGAVGGAWMLAIAGGRGAFKGDMVGIGGGLTALIGMVGGAFLGAMAGAIAAPFMGYDRMLELGEDMLRDMMKGLPGS